jgi:hypothetical protein
MMAALAVHLPLMVMQLPLKSYDTNFHIFFASHYLHHWFNPWNPKWYAGFSQTTYPPLPQQWIAVLAHITGLDYGYMIVQLAAILLLVIGVYRFSLLWVDRRSASLAALASVFLGSESLLVYSAGQLGTTSAAPIYLNALPYLFEWLRHGKWRSLLKATALFAAAAAAHHATLLFGSFLFAIPILFLAILDRDTGEKTSGGALTFRTILAIVLLVVAVIIVLLPFWIALLHYQVTQTPIPHLSRANYILSLRSGVNYFIIPYGAIILALPFIVIRGSRVVRLRPLLIGFWVAFLLGLGGTTPVGHILLGRAYEVLTMERFSYWAGLLAMPFIGLLAAELLEKHRRGAIVGLSVAAALSCAIAVAWSTYSPPEGAGIKIDSVAQWLNRDGHDNYRYFTLGFGDQISRLAIMTDASSVDGEWNSARQLPELTKYGAGKLSSSKYFGKAGIDSLQAMMRHSDKYGIKWIFVRDAYYDPLLKFSGWRPVDQFEDKTITVWDKDGVPPAMPINVSQEPSRWQGIIWGIFPIGSSILAILLLIFIPVGEPVVYPGEDSSVMLESLPAGSGLMSNGRLLALCIGVATIIFVVVGTAWPNAEAEKYAGGKNLLRLSTTPQAAVQNLGDEISLHAWAKAYGSLGNKGEFTEQEFIHDVIGYRLNLRTYATLEGFDVRPLHATGDEADVRLRMRWSAVVGTFSNMRDLRVVKSGDRWKVDWPLGKHATVPPQVMAVNYLRWDVIYPGQGDDWGAQDVESPHVRIVDMHPVQRADGVVILGELLNQDVVPAYVSVRATLLAKNGEAIGTEGSFDKISHILLPKQVTPFFINFPGTQLSDVDSVRMDPLSALVSASADPVIEIQDQKLKPAPNATLTGQLVNQSGQVVNIAHVLGTFYDKTGQVVWIADQYPDRALLPQVPVPFSIHIPEDLARKINSQRTVVATYSVGAIQ